MQFKEVKADSTFSFRLGNQSFTDFQATHCQKVKLQIRDSHRQSDFSAKKHWALADILNMISSYLVKKSIG